MPMNNQYPCWYPLQIRFRDLDPLAHVNNTVYFTEFFLYSPTFPSFFSQRYRFSRESCALKPLQELHFAGTTSSKASWEVRSVPGPLFL